MIRNSVFGLRSGAVALTIVFIGLMSVGRTVEAAPNAAQMLLSKASQADGVRRIKSLPYRSAERQVLGLVGTILSDREALRILVEVLGVAQARGARLLAKVAESKDADLALLSYRKLISMGESKRLRRDMVRRLKGAKHPLALRKIASEQLVKLGEQRIVSVLERIISNDREQIELRTQAVFDLAKLRGGTSVRFINLAYQKSRLGFGPKNLRLRRALIGALAQLETEDSIPTLIDALRIPELWHSAVDALVRLGDRSVPSLRLVLETADDHLEPGVLAVLFRLKQIDTSRFLHMVSSSDRSVREKARWVLTAFPDVRVVDTLAKHWKDNEIFPTKREILNLLAPHYGHAKTKEIFKKALQHRTPEIRSLAMEIVVSAGDKSFSAAFLSIAEEDAVEALRIQAVQSMVYLNMTEGRPLLERMLQYETRAVLKVASWALGWVGSPRTTPGKLRLTRKFRHPEIMPQLVKSAARLTGIPFMRRAEPGHYRNIPVFDGGRASKAAGVKTKVLEFEGQELTVATFGSGPPLLVFAPLKSSDSSAMLKGLKAVAGERKVILFYDANASNEAPYRVNALLGAWMERAAEAVLKDLGDPARVDVSGWSLGATWALQFCAKDTKRCKKLALVAPMSIEPSFWKGVPGMVRASLGAELTGELAILEDRRGQFAPVAWATHYQRFLARFLMVNPVRAAMLSQSDFPLLFEPSEVAFVDVKGSLRTVLDAKIPTAAVLGNQDPMGGSWRFLIEQSKTNSEDGRSVKVLEMEDTGHLVLYEAPAKAGELVVDFID